MYWYFDLSDIPANAVIDSVVCKFKAYVGNDYYTTSADATLVLSEGDVEKSSVVSFDKSQITVYTISDGQFTRQELDQLELRLRYVSTTSQSSRRTFYFYGADLTVTYTYQSEKFMLKLGGKYNDVARVFKKVNGIWVEQEELANVVDQTKRLVNGVEYVVELPEGYTRLEYIESTGEEYIDLGVSIGPDNAASIKTIVNKKIKNLGSYALDGTGFGSAPYNNSFYVGIDASGNIAYGNGRADETTTQAYDGTWKTFTYSGEGKITITGMSDISFTFQAPDTALNFFLFAYNQGTNGIKKYSGRISDAQIIENGTVIRNVIACRQDATGIVGMYDVKNGVFYHSASGVELKAPGEVPLTFTVYGTAYQFEDGMTWGEWLDSDYNTSANIMAASGYVVMLGASQYNVLDSSGNKVPTTALIIEGEAYTV